VTSRPPEDYRKLIEKTVEEASFLRLTLSAPVNSADAPWRKISARPVEIRAGRQILVTFSGKSKSQVKHFAGREWIRQLDEMLAQEFTQVHVQTGAGDLHIRITRKGRALVSRGAPSAAGPAPDFRHNRAKEYPLAIERPDAFLEAIGIKNERGKVRPSMQAKFRQINSFISLIEPLVPEKLSRPLRILDCGCGSAYLTFALYHCLAHARGIRARLTGIDKNRDAIGKCVALRDRLGWSDLRFEAVEIASFVPAEPPDLVLSLHACDAATDEAIAKGILWNSRAIVAAPCCQHELHHKIRSRRFSAVLRHGILRERLADILTDTFRALVLRIMGYRAQVVEFVSPDATPKNLLIRAEKIQRPGDVDAVREYLDLKKFWSVEPAIEGMLGAEFRGIA
jgi:SAM-dependent methyltransferase